MGRDPQLCPLPRAGVTQAAPCATVRGEMEAGSHERQLGSVLPNWPHCNNGARKCRRSWPGAGGDLPLPPPQGSLGPPSRLDPRSAQGGETRTSQACISVYWCVRSCTREHLAAAAVVGCYPRLSARSWGPRLRGPAGTGLGSRTDSATPPARCPRSRPGTQPCRTPWGHARVSGSHSALGQSWEQFLGCSVAGLG